MYNISIWSYYDVCMRCLDDVSRGKCEVTRGFLFEFSCGCGLERDTWIIYTASKACCLNRYTSAS